MLLLRFTFRESAHGFVQLQDAIVMKESRARTLSRIGLWQLTEVGVFSILGHFMLGNRDFRSINACRDSHALQESVSTIRISGQVMVVAPAILWLESQTM